MIRVLSIFLSLLVFSSCITPKVYNELLEKHEIAKKNLTKNEKLILDLREKIDAYERNINNLTSSVDGLVIPTPTRHPDPDTFASVIPITTVVVALGTTYTFWVVIPTFAFVFNLKVFAIFYPNAIARAVISPAVAAGFPAIFSVPVIFAVPWTSNA